MCGRYFFDDTVYNEIEELTGESAGAAVFVSGDVCPSDQALILTGKKPAISMQTMRWGFPQYQKKGLIINARSETVLDKKMFRQSILGRRCIIPAGKYYEWDADKNKVTFQRPDSSVIFMAGFYNLFDEECFTILTTQANPSVLPVHDRMPLILEKEEIEDWIYDEDFFKYTLNKVPGYLMMEREFEQMSLF